MWVVFLGVGKGFVWDRDLVCVSGGCVVWNSTVSLFMSYFWLCLDVARYKACLDITRNKA